MEFLDGAVTSRRRGLAALCENRRKDPRVTVAVTAGPQVRMEFGRQIGWPVGFDDKGIPFA